MCISNDCIRQSSESATQDYCRQKEANMAGAFMRVAILRGQHLARMRALIWRHKEMRHSVGECEALRLRKVPYLLHRQPYRAWRNSMCGAFIICDGLKVRTSVHLIYIQAFENVAYSFRNHCLRLHVLFSSFSVHPSSLLCLVRSTRHLGRLPEVGLYAEGYIRISLWKFARAETPVQWQWFFISFLPDVIPSVGASILIRLLCFECTILSSCPRV